MWLGHLKLFWPHVRTTPGTGKLAYIGIQISSRSSSALSRLLPQDSYLGTQEYVALIRKLHITPSSYEH